MNVPKIRFNDFDVNIIKISIKELGNVITGTTPSTTDRSNYGDEYLWASPVDMGDFKYINNTKTKLSEKGFNKTRCVPKDSILITCIGSTIGKTGMASKEMSTNQQINTLIPNKIYNSDYLYYCINFNFPRFLNKISFQAVPIISKSEFEKLEVSITKNIYEQEKIGKLLSLLDKKIELQSKKIEDLKLFTKKIFNETIKGKEYHEYRIEELFKVSAGGDIKKENVSLVKNDIYCYPIFSNNLENDGLYGYSNLYKIDKDSITVTGRGDIGKALCRKQNYYPIVRLLVLIPKMELNLKFYQECINNLHIVKESTGVPQLTAPQISNYKVIYPSIDFQNKIGKTIELNEKKIDLELSKLNNLLRLKKWLMQNMFV